MHIIKIKTFLSKFLASFGYYGEKYGGHKKGVCPERGLILFSDASEAIRAEDILKKAGYGVKMVAPPPHFRKGCDLAVEFPLIEQLGIEIALNGKGKSWVDIIPISEETLKPVSIVKVRDFNDWLMVRAANMKLTIDKKTGVIVNISGGGCPDVPYLAYKMIGNCLSSAPSPKKLGNTVCAYALHIAFEKCKEMFDSIKC